MHLYLAGEFDLAKSVPPDQHIPNLLKSYYYLRDEDDETIAAHLQHCDRFMLDSGAFTFLTNPNADVSDLDSFVDGYIDFVNRWDIERYIEMDVDSRRSLAEVREWRAQMERETGRDAIPVWHPSRGRECFIRLCEEYDYIGLGGIYDEVSPKWFKFFPWFIRQAHMRGCRIHALGFTPTKELATYPFDSLDSRSWLMGSIVASSPQHTFTGTELETVTHEGMERAGDYNEIRRANCRAWIQYARYLENKHGLENYDGPRLDQGDAPPPEHIDGRAAYHLPPESTW